MSEQEFPPPRRPARSYRPDRDDDDPPPWANLPPVRPTQPARSSGGGNPYAGLLYTNVVFYGTTVGFGGPVDVPSTNPEC